MPIKSESSPPPLRALRPLREKNMLAKHAGLAKKISLTSESSPQPLRTLRPLREKNSRKARRARHVNFHYVRIIPIHFASYSLSA